MRRAGCGLGIDIQEFSEDEEVRLVAGMRDALADAAEPITLPELREVAAQMPALGRSLIALHRRSLEAAERLEMLAQRLGDGRSDAPAPRAMPPPTSTPPPAQPPSPGLSPPSAA